MTDKNDLIESQRYGVTSCNNCPIASAVNAHVLELLDIVETFCTSPVARDVEYELDRAMLDKARQIGKMLKK